MTLLLFDLNPTGHHPGYLQHLIRYWRAENGLLLAVVSADFPHKHLAIAALADQTAGVALRPISAPETEQLATESTLLARAAAEWRLMVAYATREGASHVLLMYLDQFQMALLTEKAPPCPVSGILFRPTLHYAALGYPPVGLPERLRELRKRTLLRLVLRRRRLHTVFCLDPYCLPTLRQWSRHTRFVFLPDPVEAYPVTERDVLLLREKAELDASRKTLLLFGHLDGRKGLEPLAEAVARLPEATRRALTLWLVGPLEDDQAGFVEKLAALPGLHLRRHHRFVPDEHIQAYFGAADGVLALYQRHVGMSAVLARAAAAGKPVLASDYGLLGQLVREKALGLTVDAASPEAIAHTLQGFAETPRLGNPEQMHNFAELNRASEYARVIFESLIVKS